MGSVDFSKQLVIIAGPNGAGKTTFALDYLPNYVQIPEFVNADFIAAGLSPFNQDKVAIQAGRLMLARIHELAAEGKSFSFETTLAGLIWKNLILELKRQGYQVNVFYLTLDHVEIALERVRLRKLAGGHDIPELTLKRRFTKSPINFWNHYRGLADRWHIFNASQTKPIRVAYKENGDALVEQDDLFQKFLQKAKNHG